MTSMVFASTGTNVTENTTRLFVATEINVKAIKHVKRGTQKFAEPLKEKVSAPMEKTVHTTTKLEMTVKEKQTENTVKEKETTVIE